MIRSFMPEPYPNENEQSDSMIIVCGPPKLKDSVNDIITNQMGWKNAFIYDWNKKENSNEEGKKGLIFCLRII